MDDLEVIEAHTVTTSDDVFLSFEEILQWKKVDMMEWLSSRKYPKSGTKDVLTKRIFRAMRQDSSDESDVDSDTECEPEPEIVVSPPEMLITGWKEVTEGAIAVLEDKDIENYFVHHKDPLSGKEGNFHRQLVKAKKLANEKHVSSIHFHSVSVESPTVYVKGQCFPTMRQNVQVELKGAVGGSSSVQQYTQFITLSKSSSFIIRAKCNCKAGVAGLCAHVGACLFVLSHVTKPSCTSSACSWTKPPMKTAPAPERWEDIRFVNTENRSAEDMQTVKPLPGVYQAGPCSDPSQFLADFLSGLGEVNPSCVLYTTLCSRKEDISTFLQQYQPDFCFHDCINLNGDHPQEVISSFICDVHQSVTPDMCTKLQQSTLGQHNNQNWQKARSVLITSSNFGTVCKRRPDTPADNLVKVQRGYNILPDGIKSIAHGRKNEPKARKVYAQHHRDQCDTALSVTEAGLAVDPTLPYLGTSVDGVVDCPKCGRGIVEIKCPYGNKKSKWRNIEVEECCLNSSFCCEIDSNNKIILKKNHNYYFQIMGQLAITGLNYCDFVIYTKKGISVQRFVLDKHLWMTMMSKLSIFYRHMVAEILSNRIQRGKPLYV